jgi:hypothetical protein
VFGQNQRASAMKEWDPSQSHGKESAKQEALLTHPIVIGEPAFFNIYIYIYIYIASFLSIYIDICCFRVLLGLLGGKDFFRRLEFLLVCFWNISNGTLYFFLKKKKRDKSSFIVFLY